MSNDELDDVTAWTEYRWTCPHCSEVNDAGDIEPSGETQCDECGAISNVTGTM